MAGRGGDDAAIGQHPGLAVPADGERHDHRRRHRQGRHRHHRPARRADVRRDRAAGAVRGRRGLLRLAHRDGLRPRPPLGDVPPRHHLLRARDRPIRRTDAAHPHHQRRPPDPVPGADGLHRAGRRADHVRRRDRDGHPSGRRAVVAAAGQRPGTGGGQLLDHLQDAAAVSQHAAADRQHQPGHARAAVRRAGGARVRARTVRASAVRRGQRRAVQHRAEPPATGRR